jgi:hypothetical protein
MPNIITIQDIKEVRPLAQLDPQRVDPYITEAQENDLRPIMGDAFFYDLITNIETTKYRELLKGKTYTKDGYTIFFPGLKPMLCYFALARIVQNNAVNITSFGITQKNIEGSQPVDQRLIGALVTELKDVANSYQTRLIDFVSENQTTYPLFNVSSGKDETEFGLNFFSA